MAIVTVCWFDMDRNSCGVIVESGPNQWGDVLTVDDLWEQCRPEGTKFQFREDLRGQAQWIVENGEARPTAHA
jgi:hypothetical protein